MTRIGYISLFAVLFALLLTGCFNKKSRYPNLEPLQGLPPEEKVGKAHVFPLSEAVFSSYQVTDPLRQRISPLREVSPNDLPFEVLRGQEIMDGEQLYVYVRTLEGGPRGIELKFEYYFLENFNPTRFTGDHPNISDLALDITVMDATENIIFRDTDTEISLSGRDSAYYCDHQMTLLHTQLRNFTPGQQSLTLRVEAVGENFWGSQTREKLLDFEVKFEQDLPPLVLTRISYQECKLTQEAYARSWDEGFANPRPDLYWFFELENYEVYRSGRWKNSQQHGDAVTFDLVHYDLEDEVRVVLMDGDVLFNADDRIGQWKGTVQELLADDYLNLTMDSDIEYFYLKAKHEGDYNPR